MRVSKYLALAAIFAASAFFAACNKDDDNPSNPNTGGSYYPYETVGSYWVYEGWETDSLGNQVGEKYYDSTYISSKGDFQGKAAVVLSDFDGKNTVDTFMVVSPTANTLYAYNDFLIPSEDMLSFSDVTVHTDSIPRGWITLADQSQSQWTLIPEVKFSPITVKMGPIPVTFTPSWKSAEQKIGVENITYQGKTIKATKYTITNHLGAYVQANDLGVDIKVHLWFAEGIGLIRQKSDFVSMSYLGVHIMDIPGSDQILLRHNIKAKS